MATQSPVLSSLPHETQQYIKACEHPLSSLSTPDRTLSVTEQEILEYYVEKLQAHLRRVKTQPHYRPAMVRPGGMTPPPFSPVVGSLAGGASLMMEASPRQNE